MTAQPKKKISKVRGKTRRANYSADFVAVTKCGKCGAPITPHQICKECGFYRGQKLMTTSADKKTKLALKKSAKKTKKTDGK